MVALGSLAALAALVLAVVLRSEGTYEVTAVFEDVRGLVEGGDVKAGGLEVGTVEEISFDDSGMPVVRMRIESDLELRQGAFANLRLASNIGALNRFVDLTQGEGEELGDGARLGPSRTDQPVNLDLAVSALDPRTRGQAARLLANVDAATRERGPDLARTLRHSARALGETANLLAGVTADQLALERLVTQGRTVVSALAENPADLGATAERLAMVLDAAASRQLDLRRTVDAIGPGLENARTVLDRLERSTPNLREFVGAARPAVAELGPTVRVLRPALEALAPLAREARRVTAPLREQLRALEPVIDAALPITRRLDPVLAGLNPLLDHMRARGPEVINFFTLAGDATSNYDANGNLIRVSTVLIQRNRHPEQIEASSDAAGSVVRPFDREPGVAEGEPWSDYWESFIGGGKPPQHFLGDKE
jgi:phospholipid/cholesterol/gamma-HCH transport system substrate-binding protein